MKKFLLTLGVASMALTSFSATRVLYQQNFENVNTPAEAGWSEFGGESITIASDEYGKYLQIKQGQVNGRSCNVTWGQDIFMKDGAPVLEGDTYNMTFAFSYEQGSNNQYNSAITVFTNHKGVDNQPYRNPWSPAGYWQNYLYDMSQVNNEPLGFAINGGTVESEEVSEDGNIVKTYAIDYADEVSVTQADWYTVSLDVNVATREVEYSVVSLSGESLQSGSITVPENDVNGDPISMYAEGIWVMMARYQTIVDIDDIKISYESEFDVANPPTIALTRIGKTADDALDLNLRAYTISFMDGETLHVTGTDGNTVEVDYADYDGQYAYETTTSGVLKAWTTSGTATSDAVEVEVECVPVVLPEVVATITSVEAGFGKTYTLSVSNSDVPLQPTIFINYEFIGANGETLSAEGEASGVKVTLPGEGTLKLTSEAFGYQATSSSVENDIEFAVKNQWDFARMTDEEIVAAGFPATYDELNSSNTSGFDNWTARHRLFYYDAASETVNEEGETVYTEVYPFGWSNGDEMLYYTTIAADANPAGKELFEGITIYAGHNVRFMKHLGMVNDETSGGNNKNIDVLNLDATDFVVINKINNYGGNSNHPICNTVEEYYEVLEGENEVFSASANGVANEDGTYTVSCPVYRIDTLATCITVFKQAGTTAVEGVDAAVVGDNNWYSIDGVRVAQPTRPGLYIHNGKKIIVK